MDESGKVVLRGELASSKRGRQIIINRAKDPLKRRVRPYFLIKSAQAKKSDDVLMAELVEQRPTWNKMRKDHAHAAELFGCPEYPLRIHFHLIRKTHRIFDYINIIQGLLDQMKKAGYIPDDSMKYVIPVFYEYEVDRENPRTIIWL